MSHVTLTTSMSGWFVIHRLELAMVNLHTKFEVCIFTFSKIGKATKNTDNWLKFRPHRMPCHCHYWRFNDPFCCIPSLTTKWSLLLRGMPKTANAFEWTGQNCPLPVGDLGPHGPTQVSIPNGISIGSAVFAELTNECNKQTYRQTDHATLSAAIARI